LESTTGFITPPWNRREAPELLTRRYGSSTAKTEGSIRLSWEGSLYDTSIRPTPSGAAGCGLAQVVMDAARTSAKYTSFLIRRPPREEKNAAPFLKEDNRKFPLRSSVGVGEEEP
jgi:hypothetical protein